MEYPSLLLLLVLAASAFSVRSQCPSAEDIYPCVCRVDFITEDMSVVCGLTTSLNDLKSALSQFSKEEEIFSIKLYFVRQQEAIPSNFFERIAVKQISINYCEIDFENGKPPLKGLEDSLQVLTIESSLTQKNVPLYLKLGHLKELEILKLSKNKITELRDDMFDDEMPNLHSLVLDFNLIEKIGERTFENLTNLKYFTLTGNKLGSLQRNMIPTPATQLIELSLDNNGLTDIPEDLFISMPSLYTISLRKNKMKTLDCNTWKHIVYQLGKIHLDDNRIQCDSGMDWIINMVIDSLTFQGKCAGPTKEKGMPLWRFINNGREKIERQSSTV